MKKRLVFLTATLFLIPVLSLSGCATTMQDIKDSPVTDEVKTQVIDCITDCAIILIDRALQPKD